MKKSLIQTIAVAIAMATTAPLAALAQANNPTPATRAQVRHELVQLENSGYSPAGGNIEFPDDLQAAEARSGAATVAAMTNAYGGGPGGTTDAGSRVATPPKSLYLDNGASLYVGD